MNNYKEIKFSFNQFEIDKMINIPKILIIGSINKYSIIKDLLYNLRSVQHSKHSDEIMDNVFNRQSKLLNTLNSTDKRTLVVLDDCVQSNIFFNSNHIRSLYFEGRCWSLPSILTIPYPISIQPEIRCQFDYVFLLPDNDINHRKKIFDYYGDVFCKFEYFNYVFSCITENNGCMVINNRIKTSIIEKKIFWYNVKSSLEFAKLNQSINNQLVDNQLADNQLMYNQTMNNNDNLLVSNSLSKKRTFDQMSNNNKTQLNENIFSYFNLPIGNTKIDKTYNEWIKIWNNMGKS